MRGAEPRLDRKRAHERPDLTYGNECARTFDGRAKPVLKINRQHAPAPFRFGNHGIGGGHINRHRFFDQHMLTGPNPFD